jgi:tetratricopeptide (TPR) repeat protein
MARGAHREAVPYLEQALGTLRHLPETRPRSELAIDIRIEFRNALIPLGDWARVLDLLQEAEVLARSLGDQHRLGRIAAFMMIPWRVTGDFDAALKSGQEALAIAHTLSDRSIEVVATPILATRTSTGASTPKQSNCSSGTSDSTASWALSVSERP